MFTALRVDPADAVPIWRQIETAVRRLVVTESIPAGQSVPSVRELARHLRVNPATVAKAYQRLTDAGVLTVRRGEGTFVAQDATTLPAAERDAAIAEAAERYVEVVRSVGGVRGDAVDGVGKVWDELFGDGHEGERS